MHRPQVSANRPASTFFDENSLLSYLLCLLMADLSYYMVLAFHVPTALSNRPKYSYEVADNCCLILFGLPSVVVFKVESFNVASELPTSFYHLQFWVQLR